MAFKRKIYNKLLEWKNEIPKNSALLIEGARRNVFTALYAILFIINSI